MTIKERINADFMEAYKAKDMKKKDFLGVLKGAIQTQEGKMIESTDENVLKVIKSFEKGIVESIEMRKSVSLDVTEQEAELSFIKVYQPASMSDDEITSILTDIISRVPNKNEGTVMGFFNKENKGKVFDNKAVLVIAKKLLV